MKSSPCAERHSDPTEIRFGERIPIDLPVRLAANGIAGAGVLRDISISGALIETALDLPVFTNLVVTVPAPGESAPAQDLAACVVRRSIEGIGIEWRDMACPTLQSMLARAMRPTA